jgi:hypothetical protein
VEVFKSRDHVLRQSPRSGDLDGVPPAIVLDRRIGAGLDQQVQGLQPLEPCRIEDRRFTVAAQIEPGLGLEQRAQHLGIVAKHRGPERIAGIAAALQEKLHQGKVLAAGDRVPDRVGAEVAFLFRHRDTRFEIGTGFQQRGDGCGPICLAKLGSRRHRAGEMNPLTAFRIGGEDQRWR